MIKIEKKEGTINAELKGEYTCTVSGISGCITYDVPGAR